MNASLRIEKSENISGKLINEHRIPLLREKDYYVKNFILDGDAPKQFIKAYYFEKGSPVRRTKRQSWPGYIAKTAEKWYPHESVIEYMINRIGQELGVGMNEIRLVKANGQIRFLSRYFKRKDENLIHGAEICGAHLGDEEMAAEIALNRKTARELFTFEFIRDAIRSVFPQCFETLLIDLVKMIAFDALVGNNDRHFYNWGVIAPTKKSSKMPTFAPLYDSARGLLWNLSDENISRYLAEYRAYVKMPNPDPRAAKRVVTYIENASPRISIEENHKANHFELVDFVKRLRIEYATIVKELSSVENEENVKGMLQREFYPMFTTDRQELLSIILTKRFEKIRNL